MNKIIDKCQTGFIKERNIMDGVMVLHEILHDTKNRKREGLVLKLGFVKAYDKINRDFFLVSSEKGVFTIIGVTGLQRS